MKRTIAILILLLALCGCGHRESTKKLTKLYYPQSQISYGSQTSSIGYETRDTFAFSNEAILQSYLEGPSTASLNQPFPANVSLTLLKVIDKQASIVLSDEYATLNGISLSIANACLSKTVMELCNVDTVTIQCESSPLGGSPSITIGYHELLIFDDSTGPAESSQTSDTSE